MSSQRFEWKEGQRVTSQTEPELGLGLVVKVIETSLIEVLFSEAGLVRRYSAKSSPLRRLVLQVGQTARTKEGTEFEIARVDELDGLIRYWPSDESLSDDDEEDLSEGVWEYELDASLSESGALDSFVSGRWSEDFLSYDLRGEGWQLKAEASSPGVRGLVGPRVTLLPHQFYIASEVSNREYPRVLLADEVGLGKTIEAALIFSSLRALDRANRVLIVVPEALKHQWLAEMYRRFNESFQVLTADDLEENPEYFKMSSRVIASWDLLLQSPETLLQAAGERWDLLIIDEAHHLGWHPDDPSAQWLAASELSAKSRGLLLLTATPRQHGVETQFGLLNLVDPARFSNFETFQSELGELRERAELARSLVEGKLQTAQTRKLEELLIDDPSALKDLASLKKGGSAAPLLQALIDRHGTGRVFFRNRREKLKGFPKRELREAPLDTDTRLEWLRDFLNSVGKEKVLLLCTSPQEALRVFNFIEERAGHKKALFHEGMDIIERDRQAAWFAEPNGAQILISSEIGGEGRNFQFCRHLVLFDLPEHPDLLEQRIGRLDRIGQKHAIQIHVPWIRGTESELLLRWYRDGIGAFEQAVGEGAALVERVGSDFEKALSSYRDAKAAAKSRETLTAKLIERSQAEILKIREEQQQSIDFLVDLNSFDEARGRALSETVAARDKDPNLEDYMEQIFEHFGIDSEDHSPGIRKITAGPQAFVENFPELPADSEKLITYDREIALVREDVSFLTQDHPMVQGALSFLLDRGEGEATVCLWPGSRLQGALFEFSFILQATGSPALELERYLPITRSELVLDYKGQIVAPEVLRRRNSARLQRLPEGALRGELPKLRQMILPLVEKAQKAAETAANDLVKQAIKAAQSRLESEQTRLTTLKSLNGTVSKREVEAHRLRSEATLESLAMAQPRLDAIRMTLCQ